MRNTNKKGFTIVELVIVVAVIAILAAVLIPTFSGIIRKANESKDTQLVKNLNTALAADVNGDKTIVGALAAAAEFGYDVAKINASATDNQILWDSVNNVFCYLKSGASEPEYIPEFPGAQEVTDNAKYWVIDDAINTIYSTYYYGSEKIDSDTTTNICVETNGEDLEINAPNATVLHYGEAGDVIIKAVHASASYHEFGSVASLKVTKGHIVPEAGSKIQVLAVVGSEVTVKVESTSAEILVVVIDSTNASGIANDIKEAVKDVVDADAIKEATSDKIDEVISTNKAFADGNGTKENPYIIMTAEQLKNIGNNYDKGYAYYKVADGVTSIDCSGWTRVNLNGSFDGNGVTLENLDNILFANIAGDNAVVSNINIDADISLPSGAAALAYKSVTTSLTIDNVDVSGIIIGSGWTTSYIVFGPGASDGVYKSWDVKFINCESNATLVSTSGSASGFVGHPYNDVSNGNYLTGGSLITIIDSIYNGRMSATGSSVEKNYSFKYFTINGNDNRVKTSYSADFINTYGAVEGVLYAAPNVEAAADGSKTFYAGNYGDNCVDYYRPGDTSGMKAILNTKAQATLPANVGDVFTVNKVSGAVSATVSLTIAPNDPTGYGSYLGTYMSETIDIKNAEGTFNSESVKYFNITINEDTTTESGLTADGNTYNVVNSFYGVNNHNGASVKIVQYDVNGNVLNITTIVIAEATN